VRLDALDGGADVSACEATVFCGRDASACTRPAAWHLHLEDGPDYWACATHAIDGMMHMGATCTDAADEPVELDPETGELQTVTLQTVTPQPAIADVVAGVVISIGEIEGGPGIVIRCSEETCRAAGALLGLQVQITVAP